MNPNTLKWVILISKGALSGLMLKSGIGYFINPTAVIESFAKLGFPDWLVLPLGAAKVVGVLLIWLAPKAWMRHWAYAGFFFNTVLAFTAHIMVQDGHHWGAVGAFVLTLVAFATSEMRP